MEGIIEISKKAIYGCWQYAYIFGIISFFIFSCIFTYITIKNKKSGVTYDCKNVLLTIIVYILGAIASCMVVILADCFGKILDEKNCPVLYYEYTVKITDDVDFGKFKDTYKILRETEDNTYIVILKEN